MARRGHAFGLFGLGAPHLGRPVGALRGGAVSAERRRMTHEEAPNLLSAPEKGGTASMHQQQTKRQGAGDGVEARAARACGTHPSWASGASSGFFRLEERPESRRHLSLVVVEELDSGLVLTRSNRGADC
jgi:hypothetical protein